MEKVVSGNIKEIGHNSKDELIVAFKNDNICHCDKYNNRKDK
jgi:hypothetical protein